MRNPFVKDDNDNVKYVSVVTILAWVIPLIVVALLLAMVFSGVATAASGVFGMIPWAFQVLGIIICPLLVPALFIAAYVINKKANDEPDAFLRHKHKTTVKWLVIIGLILLVYMIIMYVIWIVASFIHVAVTS